MHTVPMVEGMSERAAWKWRTMRWARCLALLCVAAAVEASAQTATPRFRLAIVGLTHGHSFIAFRTLTTNTAVEVVAISDPSADLRAQAAGIWPGVKLYEDHRRLLDEVKPDGVWSFVDNHQHVAITKDCAERGISVMFEKPMATTHADAIAIRDIAKARGIQVVINSQPPWWPANHTASQLARSGELGAVWRVHTVSGHGGPGGGPGSSPGGARSAAGSAAAGPPASGGSPPPARTAGSQAFWSMLNSAERGGGVLLDFGPYGAAWVRWYLGMPTTVYAIRTQTRPGVYQVPTTTAIVASYPDHRIGLIEASWDLPRNIEQLEVFGDRGSVDLVSNSGSQLIRFETWAGRERREAPLVTLEPHWADPATYFAHAVRRGEVDEFVSAAFHADVMAILEAAQRSADNGQPVSVASVTGR
jgi:predicted dehydrogenase